MRFDRHCDRRVGNTGRQFCQSVSRTGHNRQNIKFFLRADRLCLLDRVDDRVAGQLHQLISEIQRIPEPCVRRIGRFRHDRRHIDPALHDLLERLQGF